MRIIKNIRYYFDLYRMNVNRKIRSCFPFYKTKINKGGGNYLDLKKIHGIGMDIGCSVCKHYNTKHDTCKKTKCQSHLAWDFREKIERGYFKSYYKDRHPLRLKWAGFKCNRLEPWLKKRFPKRFKQLRRINGRYCISLPWFKAFRKNKLRKIDGKNVVC